ncbi:MAG: hypothetical protein LLF92_11865 [Planctomycetaceae bacterium]|nr:hypothetical protein [Planctomycetaceae bacterium]
MKLTRQKCTWSQLIFLVLLIFISSTSFAQLTPRAKKLLHAKTVQIDLGFDIYKDRSARSIAEEIIANGYEGVFYFVTSDKGIRKDVIEELQKRDIPVAALLCASGTYMPEDERIKDWEKYRMEFTNNSMDQYKLMTFIDKDYLAWMKNRVVAILSKNGFDGFTFAEVISKKKDIKAKHIIIRNYIPRRCRWPRMTR